MKFISYIIIIITNLKVGEFMDYIDKVLMEQRNFFHTGKTTNIDFRLNTLKNLKGLMISYEKEIEKALNKDLNKSAFEAYTTEIGIVLSELTYIIDNIKIKSRCYICNVTYHYLFLLVFGLKSRLKLFF